MPRRLSFAIVVVAAAALPLAAADPAADTSLQGPEPALYPLKVGNTWTYRTGDKKIVAKITKHEKFAGQVCAVLETLVDGQTAASEHLAVTKDGDVFWGMQQLRDNEDLVDYITGLEASDAEGIEPNGDDLANEIERFLEQRGGDST